MKWLRGIFCSMGWHGKYQYRYFDGASEHATCGWCEFEGMIDSQGNLF